MFKILSPCGILGYGFPKESFLAGMAEKPDAVVVDAGSTDAGPHKLGAGVAIVSRLACKKDLHIMVTQTRAHNIPLIVGSAGGSGARVHTQWTLEIVEEILREENLKAKVAVIWADIDNEVIKEKIKENKISPMSRNIKELTAEVLDETNGVVAQMGAEPMLEALKNNADIIICGRAYDPAPFAAVAIHNGCDAALSYHLGKILECGAIAAEPGSGKDCMMGVIFDDHFEVYPTNKKRACTKVSIAAHTFYEKDHPYILHGPGIVLNLFACEFFELGEGKVSVSGSKISYTDVYKIKLEGARQVAYRSFVVAGIRDPILISKLEEVEEIVKNDVRSYYSEIPKEDYDINFINYGINGVMGDLEPVKTRGHEVGLVFEVLAKTQDIASAICASVRSSLLHFGYEGRKATAGNLAFPFAPSDVNFGAVYEFSVYHLMEVENGNICFPIEYFEMGAVQNG